LPLKAKQIKVALLSLATGLSLTSIVAIAASASEGMDDCKRLESSAELVMRARQAGAPMSKIWKVAEDTHDDYLEAMYKMLAKNAYETPQYSTEPMQQRAVVDFQNTFFLACISNLEKKTKKKS